MSLTRTSSKHFKALWLKFSSLYRLCVTHRLKKSSYMWWELEICHAVFWFLLCIMLYYLKMASEDLPHTQNSVFSVFEREKNNVCFSFRRFWSSYKEVLKRTPKIRKGRLIFWKELKVRTDDLFSIHVRIQCIFNIVLLIYYTTE